MTMMIIFLTMMQLGPAHADLDVHQQKGLSDTKALLRSPTERNAFIKTDKNAKAADDKVESLVGGGANKDEVYGISADVMDKLTKSANGDPAKMQQILQEATKDPEGFYNKYFDDAAKARVRGVAGKVQSPTTSPPR